MAISNLPKLNFSVPFAMTATVVGLNVVESAPQTGRIGMSRQRVKTKNTKNFCIGGSI